MDKQVAQYLRLDSLSFQTTVQGKTTSTRTYYVRFSFIFQRCLSCQKFLLYAKDSLSISPPHRPQTRPSFLYEVPTFLRFWAAAPEGTGGDASPMTQGDICTYVHPSVRPSVRSSVRPPPPARPKEPQARPQAPDARPQGPQTRP